MRNLFTQVDIAAPAAQIWAILMDFPNYPRWNPFMRQMIQLPQGEDRLAIALYPADRVVLRLTVRPEVIKSGRLLKWHGFFLHERLFSWDHQLELESRGETCTIRQTERLTGSGVWILPNAMVDPLRFGFARMNMALRDHAEMLYRSEKYAEKRGLAPR